MRIILKFLPLLILAGVGYYLYRTNWFIRLDADFSLSSNGVSILATEEDYHHCKVKLTGEYTAEISRLRQGDRGFIPFYEFRQWNGTTLESMGALGEKVEISLRCNEGRRSEELHNPYVTH